MRYLTNAFSLNMLNLLPVAINVSEISPTQVPADAKSVIGHPDIAAIASGLLGREIPMNRESVSVGSDDELYIAQYRGPRLPEGAKELPEGATIQWLLVTLK